MVKNLNIVFFTNECTCNFWSTLLLALQGMELWKLNYDLSFHNLVAGQKLRVPYDHQHDKDLNWIAHRSILSKKNQKKIEKPCWWAVAIKKRSSSPPVFNFYHIHSSFIPKYPITKYAISCPKKKSMPFYIWWLILKC